MRNIALHDAPYCHENLHWKQWQHNQCGFKSTFLPSVSLKLCSWKPWPLGRARATILQVSDCFQSVSVKICTKTSWTPAGLLHSLQLPQCFTSAANFTEQLDTIELTSSSANKHKILVDFAAALPHLNLALAPRLSEASHFESRRAWNTCLPFQPFKTHLTFQQTEVCSTPKIFAFTQISITSLTTSPTFGPDEQSSCSGSTWYEALRAYGNGLCSLWRWERMWADNTVCRSVNTLHWSPLSTLGSGSNKSPSSGSWPCLRNVFWMH